jgi:hypothetical protein
MPRRILRSIAPRPESIPDWPITFKRRGARAAARPAVRVSPAARRREALPERVAQLSAGDSGHSQRARVIESTEIHRRNDRAGTHPHQTLRSVRARTPAVPHEVPSRDQGANRHLGTGPAQRSKALPNQSRKTRSPNARLKWPRIRSRFQTAAALLPAEPPSAAPRQAPKWLQVVQFTPISERLHALSSAAKRAP